jgi:hypothetical protein
MANWSFLNGNVGIGTSSPRSILDITSTLTNTPTGQEVMRLSSNYDSATAGSGPLLSFASQTNNIVFGQIGNRTEGVSKFGLSLSTYSSSLTEKMRITADGNVGIGITVPTALLHLSASTSSGVGVITIVENLATGGYGANTTYRNTAQSWASGLINNTGITRYTIYDITNSAERLSILNNGNVGIGTKSPDQKLTVNGAIHSTSVLVDTNVPPADYVFKKDYQLPTLSEIKAYTDKNHHLPGIPAAAEIEKNGINVGEMNMALLKKVEELTLYLIEKDKTDKKEQHIKKSLQKQINTLNKKLISKR